ncbi:MAG TPA: GAF domain-containing protein [Baekduia sp.]|uniref:GAF domain-containing protein n=1 Tax=Baekduia sp. TaxID=2600305 RepID=UPI002CC7E4A8|nr:GAF domain-containing protein [Baekduia sp.]HMJ36196.1 GAF domain-containing protein [Baekduia sp.]
MPQSPWVAVDAATIPAKLARELRDAWEDFVDGRTPGDADDPGRAQIRVPIVDSWLRSRDAGVDPHGRQSAPTLVEHDGAHSMWNTHPLAIALPLIDECMAVASVEADHLLVVSDADGMLLSIRGDVQLRNRAADEMNFVEGALWSEAGAGTNAVGTALAASHAVQVFAAEHFTEPVQRWTCAAAPINDPDTGRLLGVIDLTGDMSSVHPHSLSVVVATARAVEELLRARVRERDDRLRARYGTLLGPASAGAALVTGTGRVLLDPRGSLPEVAAIPSGGGMLVLPSGVPAFAEPVEDSDVYVVRALRPRSGTARRVLELRLLGEEPAEIRLDGAPLRLRPRHVELLTLLTLHRGRVSSEVLCAELYGDGGHPASVRVEMSRLRKLLDGVIDLEGYHLTCEVDSDLRHVRALLGRSAVREAAAAYPGPLLPESNAPGIERARDELDGWLRQAVITAEDADALWAWVRSPSGDGDLVAWRRLLAALEYTDPRRSLAAARTAALRRARDDVAAM